MITFNLQCNDFLLLKNKRKRDSKNIYFSFCTRFVCNALLPFLNISLMHLLYLFYCLTVSQTCLQLLFMLQLCHNSNKLKKNVLFCNLENFDFCKLLMFENCHILILNIISICLDGLINTGLHTHMTP